MKITTSILSKPVFCGLLILALSFICGAMNVQAQVLFDNGTPDLTGNGFYADTGYQDTMAGNVFTPTTSGTANYINFAGWYDQDYLNPTDPVPSDSFTVALYDFTGLDISGTGYANFIGSSTVSGLTRTVLGTSPVTTYSYSGFLDEPLTLNTQNVYLLLIGDTTTPYEEFVLDKSTSGVATQGYAYSPADNTLNGEANYPLSFSVSSVAVPEPSTWATALGSFVLLACLAVRRRKCAATA